MQISRLLTVGATAIALTGCSSLQRGSVVALGSAAGAAGTYALTRHSSPGAAAAYTVAGAAGGALLTTIGLGKDKKAEQEGYQAGYQQSQSDSIKREYWLRQERERGSGNGSLSYYSLPAPDDATDGVKRVPHNMVIPVVE